MWGGHYSGGPATAMAAINASIEVDKALYRQDIAASRAHAAMLGACGIIPAADAEAIETGLAAVLTEIEEGRFAFQATLEDIHMNVESRLGQLIGPAAGRLHTARSRNDQVATDFRLWVRDAIDRLEAQLQAYQSALLDQAERHAATAMPGLTHLQPAQPITFGHHLMAYVEMAGRDRGRLRDCRARLNESPLGAAALAGTGFPIDRHRTARALGFERPMANSLDAVSSRDFALEFLSAAAIAGGHLSRLAEEITLWMNPGFGFVRLSEAFTSGSSIMPQKRNPDAAELVRGKTGRLLGAFTTLYTVTKGLALAYAKDLQEDKEPVFDAADTLELCLTAMTGMVIDLQANEAAMARALRPGFITATELADWLVREAGMPFREAHHVTGRVVKLAEETGRTLPELTALELEAIDPALTAEALHVLDPQQAASARNSFGGTAPDRVREAIAEARRQFL